MRFFATHWAACAGPAALHPPLVQAPARPSTPPAPAAPAALAAPAGPAAAPPAPASEGLDTVSSCLASGRESAAAGDLHVALQWFDRAVVLAPELGIAHFCRALCLLDIGMDSEAAAGFERALRCDPSDGSVRVELARIHARTGRGDLAMLVVGPALAASPHLAERLADDPAFAPLNDHPRWLQTLGRL